MDFSVLFPRGNRVIIDVPESLQLRGARIMKRLVPVFALSLFLTFHLPTHAQTNQASDDASAVRATVTDYIEAYYPGEAKRMERALHPHYLKHMIHGDIPMREKTAAQMVHEIRSNGPSEQAQADKTERISVLDVAGDMASVKLVTPGWVDYVTLSKLDGQWKILSVVQRIDN
jgi:hypothetical protein